MKGVTVWLTGLSGAGKTTIANELSQLLKSSNINVIVIDGDEIRKGLCSDLGYSSKDRSENTRRVAEICKILNKGEILTIVSLISPLKQDREIAKQIIGNNQFVEIYIKTPIEVCQERDPKGLYKKIALGEIKNFTGIDLPYEEPINPHLTIDTTIISIDNATKTIINLFLKSFY
jgi:adenylylsulfate kinase